MSEIKITSTSDGVRLSVHVQPRASKTEIVGLHGEALKIRLKAPPVDGAANAELTAFLAKTFGLPKGGVEVVAGLTGREKVVLFRGVEKEAVEEKVRGMVSPD